MRTFDGLITSLTGLLITSTGVIVAVSSALLQGGQGNRF